MVKLGPWKILGTGKKNKKILALVLVLLDPLQRDYSCSSGAATMGLFPPERCLYNKIIPTKAVPLYRIYPTKAGWREVEPRKYFPTFPIFKIATWKEFEQTPSTPNNV